jgi:hypothetical protein
MKKASHNPTSFSRKSKVGKSPEVLLALFSLLEELIALLLALVAHDCRLGVVLIEERLLTLLCLGVGTGLTVCSEVLPPELSSLFSSILVSFDAVLRKLLTASLFFKGGIFARSLSLRQHQS